MSSGNGTGVAHRSVFGRSRGGGLPDSTDYRQTCSSPTRSAPQRGAADPNWSKSRLWADFWHLIVDFLVFLSSVKKCWNFEVASEGQKVEKVYQSVAQRSSGCQRGTTLASQGPQGGHARDQKVERGQLARGKRTRGKEGKWKSGKKGKLESKVGKKERKRDLTRQWARGPAN